MFPIKAWKIYYADGSVFSSKNGNWADAPAFGVQCVVYYHVDKYKTLHSEANNKGIYYFLGTDELKDYKMGLWMDSEGYYRIMNLALQSTSPEE